MRAAGRESARSSWRVHGARVEESAPERVGRGAIRLTRRLRVDGEREPRVGAAEAGLRGLEVDAVEHQRGGVRPAQVMKREAFEARSANRREPHPAAPTLVPKWSAFLAHEDEGIAVSAGEAAPRKVIRSVDRDLGAGIEL